MSASQFGKLSAGSQTGPVPAAAVREQLARIVESAGFVSSARLRRFLTHIVDRTLQGEADGLKELAIAMDVFDRSSEYDPNIDAIVRVEARRLRSKLKAYYEGEAGARDPVLIGLRPGSYVPIFRWIHPSAETHREPVIASSLPSACIAVLPFVNMSPEPEQDYFCDGMTEEITNSLTRVDGLKVIARTSAFHFKGLNLDIREVGQRIGADLIIEGSVRKAGEQLRITVQMVQTGSGHHLWSETFRRELKDVFAIQEEIAQRVADLLRLQVPSSQASTLRSVPGVEAYTRYLHARFLIHQQTPEALTAAVTQLRALLQSYPNYASAHSGLAAAQGLLAQFGCVSGREVSAEIKASAERAYALDPESAESCTMMAGWQAWFEHCWEDGNRLYSRAVELQPGHAAAYMFRAMALLCQRRIVAAEQDLRRSAELNPLSASDCARMAYLQYVKGHDESATQHLQRAFELDRDYPEARLYAALVRYRNGRYAEVIRTLTAFQAPLEIGMLGAALGRSGSRARAQECRDRLDRLAVDQYVTPLAMGMCAIGMGDTDDAFHFLNAAVEDRTNFINLVAVDPFFSPLAKDPRFSQLLRALNLAF